MSRLPTRLRRGDVGGGASHPQHHRPGGLHRVGDPQDVLDAVLAVGVGGDDVLPREAEPGLLHPDPQRGALPTVHLQVHDLRACGPRRPEDGGELLPGPVVHHQDVEAGALRPQGAHEGDQAHVRSVGRHEDDHDPSRM